MPLRGIISVNSGKLSIEKTVEYRNAFLSQIVYSTYNKNENYKKNKISWWYLKGFIITAKKSEDKTKLPAPKDMFFEFGFKEKDWIH